MSETLTEPLRARKRPKSKKNAEGGWEKQENVYNMFPRNKRKKRKKNLELTVTAEKRKLNGPRN